MKENLCEAAAKRVRGGIFPALPLTCGKNGELDDAAQHRYIQYMKQQPADGFTIWAHTGRGLLIDRETRNYVFQQWRKEFPDRFLIAGAGANLVQCAKSTDPEAEFLTRSLEMAESAKELGADAIMVYAPVIYRGAADQDEKVKEYYQLMSKPGLPIIAFYLYEAAGGISYSKELLRCILNMPQVLGIKMATLDSVMTYQEVSEMVGKEFPDKVLITGEDRMFGYTLMRGAQAALVGIGSACTALQKNMMNAYYQKRYEEFLSLSLKVDQLAECTFVTPMEGYIKRMLAILELLGVIPHSAAYDSFGPIQELPSAEMKKIESVLKSIGEI